MAKRGGRSGRKYVRDNRGRFATTGATARGGRLKTASGKKRAAQTVKAKTGGKPAGAIKGKIKRDPGAAKPTARSKPTAARTSKAATNTISRSPRQLNKDEKIARDVMTDKRFKSDRQRITEMQRRGVKPNVDVIGLVAKVRSKQGGGTTGKIKPAAAKPAAAKPAKRKTVNTSGASFERRRALAEPKVAANRRLKAEASRPLQFSGKKAGGKADQLFNDKVAQASYNRQRASEGVAARARRFYDGASQFYSAFSDRPRYSTIRKPAKDAGQWSSSSQSAWSNDLRKRRTGKRRFG